MALTQEDLQNIVQVLQPKFDQIDRRFEQIDRRFEKIEIRLDQIDRRFEQIDLRFEQVDLRFQEVDKQFLDMTKWIGGLMNNFVTRSEFQSLIDEMNAGFDAIMNHLADLKSYMERKFGDIDERFKKQDNFIKVMFSNHHQRLLKLEKTA